MQSWLKIKGNVLQIRVFRSEQSLEILLDNYHPVKWVEETIKCKSISDTHRTMKLVSFKTLENKKERTHILFNYLLCKKKKLKQGAHKKKLGWKLHMDFISYLSIYSSFLNTKRKPMDKLSSGIKGEARALWWKSNQGLFPYSVALNWNELFTKQYAV